MAKDMLDRIGDKVTIGDGCWLWTGARTHRALYELLVAPIPDELPLDHLCRVRHCVRPDHLEPVTPKVNSQRGIYATRTHCGQGHEYTEENTYRWPRNPDRRFCRVCQAKWRTRG